MCISLGQEHKLQLQVFGVLFGLFKKCRIPSFSCLEFFLVWDKEGWLFGDNISSIRQPQVPHLHPSGLEIQTTGYSSCSASRHLSPCPVSICIHPPCFIKHKGDQVFLILKMQYCVSHFERFSFKPRIYRIL